jgi:hypothetical protein
MGQGIKSAKEYGVLIPLLIGGENASGNTEYFRIRRRHENCRRYY